MLKIVLPNERRQNPALTVVYVSSSRLVLTVIYVSYSNLDGRHCEEDAEHDCPVHLELPGLGFEV